ncbi:SpoIIE family protein phosphatase [Streptomyces sp. NPDC051567]|uniref:SpoIIE family protein phosphatase n=1 Tax=Streptomyces sp. NPDC051567 TaxID=3365660 RepID=UPI0037AB8430
MAHRGEDPEVDWPARPDTSLALNRMGTFDWDLDSGRIHLDPTALEVLDLRPDEFDGTAAGLRQRIPAAEQARLEERIAQALKEGRTHYGAYFRSLRRDGSSSWTHVQVHVLRDPDDRPHRVIGILRDAAHDHGSPPGTGTGSGDGAGDGERAEGRRMTGVVERTTAILAHARTVSEVTDVLKDPEALGHLGAVSVMLGVVDGGRVRLAAEGRLGSYRPEIEYTRIDEQYPMSEAVRTMRPVFLASREEFQGRYPPLWPYIEPLDVRSGVYLPLIAQGRSIGALGLLYARDADFTAEDRTLLMALAGGIAQSLQRAILFEQEHDLAEGLQRTLLPRRIPEVAGARIAVRYRASGLGRDIGGDWYDVIPLGEGRVGVMTGDVEGHDTDAAAVMGQLRIVLRAYLIEGHTPGTAMARASAFLCELATGRVATCTYAEVDLTTGMLQLVRAGHLEPVVRRGDGSCHRVQIAGGLPLGTPPRDLPGTGTGYPVTSLELHPGDSLLLCTDGLVERADGDLDAGMRALLEAARTGPADVEELADVLCGLVGDAGAGDDMALLLLRRRGTPVPRGGGPLRQRLAPGDQDAPALARHLIRAAVAAWGAWEQADEIELAADELMTNVLVHTDGGGQVCLRLTAEGRIRIEVEDTSSALPQRREAGDWAVSGRGLMLVDRLADDWGVEPRGGGKCVWCEFAVPQPAA